MTNNLPEVIAQKKYKTIQKVPQLHTTTLVCNQTGNAVAPQVKSGQQSLLIAANRNVQRQLPQPIRI